MMSGMAATAGADGPPWSGGPGGPGKGSWQLVAAESFNKPMSVTQDTGWFANKDEAGTPYDVSVYDNDGEYFRAIGGEAFEKNLDAVSLHRRSFAFGDRGWLTAELAARDVTGDGRPDNLPSLEREVLPGAGPTGRIAVPHHNAGIVLRATDTLPEEYRVEVTLRGIDFGGKRDNTWHYDGKVNGYRPTGCKTSYPWSAAPNGDWAAPECDWLDVTRDANGYYFLGIMDYSNPAPRNNTFVHQHRKVVMDGYNRYNVTGDRLRYCDPASGKLQPYEWGSGNGVNMLFQTPDMRYKTAPGTEYLMKSECGTTFGGAIVSQVDLMPELLPKEKYTFAVERRDGQYVMEVSGYFRHVGRQTYRYSQPFDDGQYPIYHYNQTADEYDGRHNRDWHYRVGDAEYTDRDVWPAGSAYPDNFLIGIPHTNFYEGSANIDDIRLYVPRD